MSEMSWVTPRRAVIAGAIGVASLAGVLGWRALAASDDAAARELERAPGETEADAEVTARTASGPDAAWIPPDAPLGPLIRPTITAVTATAKPRDLGFELTVTTTLDVPPGVQARDMVGIHARCLVDGTWVWGIGHIAIVRLGPGEHTEVDRITVGGRYRLTAPATLCHLGFSHTGVGHPRDVDRLIAKKCWDGATVTDGACAPVPVTIGGKPVLELGAVRVTAAGHGNRLWLDVAIDGELRAALDWNVGAQLECDLPDGSVRSDTAVLRLRDLAPATPFTSTAAAFLVDKLDGAPVACTIVLELQDPDRLAREPLGTRCWRGGEVTNGACGAGP